MEAPQVLFGPVGILRGFIAASRALYYDPHPYNGDLKYVHSDFIYIFIILFLDHI